MDPQYRMLVILGRRGDALSPPSAVDVVIPAPRVPGTLTVTPDDVPSPRLQPTVKASSPIRNKSAQALMACASESPPCEFELPPSARSTQR